jgi:hypothetical protein
LRDFEDFFEGEILFNVTVGPDRIPTAGEIVRTFRDRATISEDLWAYMIEAPRLSKFIDRLSLLTLSRFKRQFVASGYAKRLFEVR